MVTRGRYRKLDRTDLRAFDNRMRDLVLRAMEVPDAVGRISSKGHAVLKGPGGTCTIPKTADNRARSRYYAIQAFAEAFPGVEPFGNQPVVQENHTTKEAPMADEVVASKPDEPTLECPAKGCDAVFVTEGARYSHIADKHWKCPHTKPDGSPCGYVARTYAFGGVGHEKLAHPKPGEVPAYRKAAEARVERGARKQAAAAKRADVHERAAKARPLVPTPEAVKADTEARTEERASHILREIRALIGDDPEVAPLRAEVSALRDENDALRKANDELVAKINLMREALSL